ncbi:MAG: DNA mismatch repair protein MutS, partial [Lachnospiraceae bacterium]|nr:DNA mismatch repair protein MutS [Lachnospiraceae bacterium]
MMQHYLDTKEQYKDCILFYRLGDFYEMFFDDAVTASRELELTLTGKSCGLKERAPMCGVPFHAVDTYLNKLVSKGYRVAICEQVEDPKLAKGMVKREVTRIVTPGTILNTQALDETKNNYLMCVVSGDGASGISCADITTGDLYATSADGAGRVLDEITRFNPSEIVCNNAFLISGIDMEELRNRRNISVRVLEDSTFDETLCRNCINRQFKALRPEDAGIPSQSMCLYSTGALLSYLTDTQMCDLKNITHISVYNAGKFMALDSQTMRNLEIVECMRDRQKKGSLLHVLDKTKTAMGARLLRSWLTQPLIDRDEIESRLDAVQSLKDNAINREEIREYLYTVYDLERLMGKVSYKTANPRDLVAFSSSLSMLPHIKNLLKDFDSKLLADIEKELDPLEDLHALIDAALIEEPPIKATEGGFIKEGYCVDLDDIRQVGTKGKTWLLELEAREKEKTGIKNLRIRFNRVFGYYLEVTNSNKDLVPAEWIRKQTLTGSERYTTDELKGLEDKILNAQDKIYALEYELFTAIRDKLADNTERILKTARLIARLDALCSYAYVAERGNYVRPSVNTKGTISIKAGRHPVVEQMLKNDMFIANDTLLDKEKNLISIITGPNMAGKSTYMRQTALIVLMAQTGSFVPADEADIGIVDRIFTRVGASDDLASGRPTFMVEMNEVSLILKNATKDSLIILDEIGRGTSTYDGLAIAWAVVEHIADRSKLGAKTLFATHYH